MAQWFMAALVRHPGFEFRSCQFFAFLLSSSRLNSTYHSYKNRTVMGVTIVAILL